MPTSFVVRIGQPSYYSPELSATCTSHIGFEKCFAIRLSCAWFHSDSCTASKRCLSLRTGHIRLTFIRKSCNVSRMTGFDKTALNRRADPLRGRNLRVMFAPQIWPQYNVNRCETSHQPGELGRRQIPTSISCHSQRTDVPSTEKWSQNRFHHRKNER